MPIKTQRITPFFWFDEQAEQAVALYTSVFPDSRITRTTRYSQESARAAGRKEGSVMTIGFQLDGQEFAAINGGPHFKINEGISLVVHCETQAEVDHYWERLGEGGDPQAQRCGWLKDSFGVTWQVVPAALMELLADPDPGRARRTAEAMLGMKKLDIAALRRAAG